MGLDRNGTKFLLYARRMGVSFERTAMIGRQSISVESGPLAAVMRRFGFELSAEEAEKISASGYAEEFLIALGAKEIVSFDMSSYEDASVVHDFNEPIHDRFKNKFTVVLDGGTLEHIFNFPVAIRNCMEMVRVGGHFLGITPANNHFGHGFYQFSPELYFRIFTEQNGFEVEQIAIFEETLNSPWYEVSDPRSLKERVVLVNDRPTMLLVRARKIMDSSSWPSMPQQSDYSELWRSNGNGPPSAVTRPAKRAGAAKLARLPLAAVRQAAVRVKRTWGMLNRRRKHFKKFDPEAD